jgi:ABC-2 type transport system permease protein
VNSKVTTSTHSHRRLDAATAKPLWLTAFVAALTAEAFRYWRDSRARWVLALGMVLGVVSAWTTTIEVQHTMRERAVAMQAEHSRWLQQGKKYAHSAAHYGVYVWKPVSALSVIHPGIERYVGSTVWLEAHKQNEFIHRPANDAEGATRQMPLSTALLLHVLAPLAMVLLGFEVFAADREKGRLRALRMSGAPMAAIGAGRVVVLWLLGLLLALPAVIALVIVALATSDAQPFEDAAMRSSAMLIVNAVYLALWALVITTVSAIAKTGRMSLALLMALWLLWCVILPRTAVELADESQPLPSAQVFREKLANALGEPHDPVEEARVKAAILAQYGVSDVKDMPVNWAGINLQRGEDRGDKVFDAHYGALFAAFTAQSQFIARAAWLSPTVAVAGVASAAAASDMEHHIHFTQAAEAHRRMIQRKMNDYITANPERNGQRVDADAALWRAIPRFDYRFAALPAAKWWALFLPLLASMAVAGASFVWAMRHLQRESAA